MDRHNITHTHTHTPRKISKITLVRDRATQQAKGFGYVEFATVGDLENALKLGGERMHGRPLKIDVAEPPRERGDGTTNGGSREPDVPAGNWRREKPIVVAAHTTTTSRDLPPPRTNRFGAPGGDADRGGFGGGGDREGRFERRGPPAPMGMLLFLRNV